MSVKQAKFTSKIQSMSFSNSSCELRLEDPNCGARHIDIIVLVEPISSSSRSYDIHSPRNLSPCRQSYCAINQRQKRLEVDALPSILALQPTGGLSVDVARQTSPRCLHTKCLGLHGTACFESRCLNATWESVAMKKALH